MIQNIIKGIAKAINQEFGDNYEIYSEDVSQGLKEPCFSIVHLMTTNTQRLQPRYLRQYDFDIHFFPKDKINTKRECHEVAERLFLCLEYIFFLDNTLRGIKMRDEIVDGVLHFFITYELFVEREQEAVDNMKVLTTKVGAKHE